MLLIMHSWLNMSLYLKVTNEVTCQPHDYTRDHLTSIRVLSVASCDKRLPSDILRMLFAWHWVQDFVIHSTKAFMTNQHEGMEWDLLSNSWRRSWAVLYMLTCYLGGFKWFPFSTHHGYATCSWLVFSPSLLGATSRLTPSQPPSPPSGTRRESNWLLIRVATLQIEGCTQLWSG